MGIDHNWSKGVWGDSDEDSNNSDDDDDVVAHMAIADDTASHTINQEEVCYQVSEGSQKWVLDSG
ncbi:hypothetical protein LINGRAHAP2_LOCUS2063, partial [Linum grandiflorum]